MIEAIFAFVIEAQGATEFCRERKCKPPTPITVSVADAGPTHYTKGGWYHGGDTVQIKREPNTPAWKITYAHEAAHYLQALRGQLQGYMSSPCVRWKTEEQAYEVAEQYARSIGYTTRKEGHVHGNVGRDKEKCELMIKHGLIKEFKL